MFDLTVFLELISPLVLLACLVVGYVIKHSIDVIPNKFIPLILSGLGLVLNMVINGFTVEMAVAGAFTGLVSVGMHQAFKQLVEGKKKETEEETTE